MTVNEFTNKLLPYALHECDKRGYNMAVAFTCLSQSALETGWLKSDIMRANFAPFGIKGKAPDGKFYTAKTREYVNGEYVTINATFRAYSSWSDAFIDYFNLLETGRYKECLKARTVKECVTIIKNGGYATDPNYITSVVAVYNTICKGLES